MRFKSRRRRSRLPIVVLILGVALGVVFFETGLAMNRSAPMVTSTSTVVAALEPEVTVVPTVPVVSALPSLTPEPTPPIPTPTPIIRANDPRVIPLLTGMTMPIRGAQIPRFEGELPNAPRDYRNGIHEGIDFYSNTAGVPIKIGTEVVAARAGRVVRADVEYHEHSEEEMNQLLNEASSDQTTPPEVLDALRGRQVWIYHGNGIYTRYGHLSEVGPGIHVGVSVERGQLIAKVGNSGSPEAAEGTTDDAHLHFEIRIGDEYFGKGLTPEQIIDWSEQIFTQ